MVLTARTYEQIALDEPERRWELFDGELRAKPDMSVDHNYAMYELTRQLAVQLDPGRFQFRMNTARTQHSADNVFVPDVLVVPVSLVDSFAGRPSRFEVYAEPLPFVVEVWSPSTGAYDSAAKLPRYQERGDLEIWQIHALTPRVVAWRRQADGSYRDALLVSGTVLLHGSPNVTIDLDRLFGMMPQR